MILFHSMLFLNAFGHTKEVAFYMPPIQASNNQFNDVTPLLIITAG